MQTDQLNELLNLTKFRLEKFLIQLLPKQEKNSSHQLNAALHYVALGGGKRLRPALIYATAQTLDIALPSLDAIAASIELIHCYSLVHDDLPAMDNDDLRRGKLTCHKAFDEATAILVGDALQTLAFEIISDPNLTPYSAEIRINMIQILARAAGKHGMILGQMADIQATNKTLSLKELEFIHNRKTGDLFMATIQLVLCIWSRNADYNLSIAKQLLDFIQYLGLAFQITDDILDVTSSTEVLGKPAGSDLKLNKVTFPSILGLEAAKQYAADYQQKALTALDILGDKANILRELAHFFLHRNF